MKKSIFIVVNVHYDYHRFQKIFMQVIINKIVLNGQKIITKNKKEIYQ